MLDGNLDDMVILRFSILPIIILDTRLDISTIINRVSMTITLDSKSTVILSIIFLLWLTKTLKDFSPNNLRQADFLCRSFLHSSTRSILSRPRSEIASQKSWQSPHTYEDSLHKHAKHLIMISIHHNEINSNNYYLTLIQITKSNVFHRVKFY